MLAVSTRWRAFVALLLITGGSLFFAGPARAQVEEPVLLIDANTELDFRTHSVNHVSIVGANVVFSLRAATGVQSLVSWNASDGTRTLVDVPGPIERNVATGHGRLVRIGDSRVFFSDGTPEGTRELTGFPSSFSSVASTDDYFYVIGSDGVWRSDGTSAGTAQIVAANDLASLATTGASERLVATSRGCELWGVDLQTETVESWTIDDSGMSALQCHVWPGPDGYAVIQVGEDLAARLTDGTEAGTTRAAFLDGGSFVGVAGGTFFFTRDGRLWGSDGTESGTFDLTDAVFDGVEVGSNLVFSNSGSLWASDGTPSGTGEIASFDASPVLRQGFDRAMGSSFFFAIGNSQIGRTDGTSAGTTVFAEVPVGTRLVIGTDGLGAVTSNGIDEITRFPDVGAQAERIWPDPALAGTASSSPRNFVAGEQFATADVRIGPDRMERAALLVTDGTPDGTNVQSYEGPAPQAIGRFDGNRIFFQRGTDYLVAAPTDIDGAAVLDDQRQLAEGIFRLTEEFHVGPEAKYIFERRTLALEEDADELMRFAFSRVSDTSIQPIATLDVEASPGDSGYRHWPLPDGRIVLTDPECRRWELGSDGVFEEVDDGSCWRSRPIPFVGGLLQVDDEGLKLRTSSDQEVTIWEGDVMPIDPVAVGLHAYFVVGTPDDAKVAWTDGRAQGSAIVSEDIVLGSLDRPFEVAGDAVHFAAHLNSRDVKIVAHRPSGLEVLTLSGQEEGSYMQNGPRSFVFVNDRIVFSGASEIVGNEVYGIPFEARPLDAVEYVRDIWQTPDEPQEPDDEEQVETDSGASSPEGGCGCSTNPGQVPAAALLLFVFVLLRHRRKFRNVREY